MNPDDTSPDFDMKGDKDELSSVNIYSSLVKTYRKKIQEASNFLQFMQDEENDSYVVEDGESFLKEAKGKCNSKKIKKCNVDEEITVINVDDDDDDDDDNSTLLMNKKKIPANKGKFISSPSSVTLNRKTQKLLRNLEKKKQNFFSTDVSKDDKYDNDDCICLDDNIPDPSSNIQDYADKCITVKIKWKDSLIKITMERNQKFSTVFPEIAANYLTSESCILLCLNEIRICPNDTPESLGITRADILDCYIMNQNSQPLEDNLINIHIQSGDSRKKVSIKIEKDKPLLELMEKYSKEKKIPLKKLLFKFDGEVILPNDTVIDLDMEDDSCVDVTVLS